MLELNFENAAMKNNNSELVFNQDIYSKESIKCDSSVIIHGDIESEEEIRANYSLIVFGNMKAKMISAGQDLICYGAVECDSIEVGCEVKCYGEFTIKEQAIVQGSAILNGGFVNDLKINGNLIATDSLEISGKCFIDGMLISSDGILGAGKIQCGTIFAKDYLEIECSSENNSVSESNGVSEEEMSSLNLEDLIYNKNTVKLIEEKVNINRLIKERLKVSEDEYDTEELINILSDCAEIDGVYNEYLDIFSIVTDADELYQTNDLGGFLRLSYILERIPECMQQYNACKNLKDKKYKEIRKKIGDMSVKSTEKHSDFVKYLGYMEELSNFFNSDENKLLYEKLYERIGVNSKLVFSKLK